VAANEVSPGQPNNERMRKWKGGGKKRIVMNDRGVPSQCGGRYRATRGETTTSVSSGHITKIKLPVICSPNPNATHPKDEGALTVARISALSVVVAPLTGMEKATQTPVEASQACVDAAPETLWNTKEQLSASHSSETGWGTRMRCRVRRGKKQGSVADNRIVRDDFLRLGRREERKGGWARMAPKGFYCAPPFNRECSQESLLETQGWIYKLHTEPGRRGMCSGVFRITLANIPQRGKVNLINSIQAQNQSQRAGLVHWRNMSGRWVKVPWFLL